MHRSISASIVAASCTITGSAFGTVIASQDFGPANFPTQPVDFNNGDTSSATNAPDVVHISTGPTDLGFSHNGTASTTSSTDFIGVNDDQFVVSHYSSLSGDSLLDFGNSRTGALTFDTVDLTNFNDVSFSMDFGDIVGATNTGDDDAVIRLFDGNGVLLTTLLDTRGNSNGAVTFGPLTYAFDPSVTNAYLQVDILTDDNNDGYRLDNVLFAGTLIPEPTSAAAIGLLGLAALRRRRA
ncbi:MAG: PEP-CTERM sorting domain-containing protein [Planctomycetota bacterium]